MRLLYSPIYYGIRNAYRQLGLSTHTVTVIGLPILYLSITAINPASANVVNDAFNSNYIKTRNPIDYTHTDINTIIVNSNSINKSSAPNSKKRYSINGSLSNDVAPSFVQLAAAPVNLNYKHTSTAKVTAATHHHATIEDLAIDQIATTVLDTAASSTLLASNLLRPTKSPNLISDYDPYGDIVTPTPLKLTAVNERSSDALNSNALSSDILSIDASQAAFDTLLGQPISNVQALNDASFDVQFPNVHFLNVQPLNMQPLNVQPLNVQPLNVQPLNAQPLNAQPLNAQPLNAQPLNAQPLNAQPLNAQPLNAQPLNAQPLNAQRPATSLSSDNYLPDDSLFIAADLNATNTDITNLFAKNLNNRLDLNLSSGSHSSFDDGSVQHSLQRLAAFYELNQSDLRTPSTVFEATEPSNDISHNVSGVADKNTVITDIVDTKNTTPVIAPALYSRRSTVAPRCEGVWVTPNRRSNYDYAIGNNASVMGAGSYDDSQMPLYTESDYGYYDNNNYVELRGDVKIVQGQQHIEADKLNMDLSTGVVGAQGQVLFTDNTGATLPPSTIHKHSNLTNPTENPLGSGLIGVADKLAFNTNTGLSTAYDVAFANVPMQAHGYAAKLNKPSNTRYEMDRVMFTTCPPTDRKWQLDAQKIDLDTETGRGEAYDTTFRLKGVPVFYLPYFNFPIDSRRASGFLVPSASFSSGLRLTAPYYLNIAPNYDATITTDLFSNRNPMLTGEFRYLSNYGAGNVTTTYLPNDKQYDKKDRYAFFYEHNWASDKIEHLNADIIYNHVSDADYLSDFDQLGITNNDLNLPRHAQVNYYNDYLTGQLKVETFQTLEAIDSKGNPVLDKDKPYSRLPQLSLDYRLPWFDNVEIAGIHDSAYFKKSINDGSENEKSGIRIYNALSASYPIRRTWGYMTPKVKLQHLFTAYDETSRLVNGLSKKDSSQGVLVPQVSVDAGLNFYQAGSPFHWFDDTMGGYQLLTPRIKYMYSPYQKQNGIPNFNTRVASINYEQLFEDSWLLGYDRLSDNHAITPGINYRYIDAKGITRFDGSIAQQFYLDRSQVTLENNKPILTGDSSGIVWSSSAQPYRNLWLDFNGALKTNGDTNFLATQVRYQPTPDSLLNIGYIKRNKDDNANQLSLSAWTASTLFPINDRWRVLAQGQYDYKSNRVIDSVVGLDYEDCCYGFSIYNRRNYNDLNLKDDPNQSVMLEFRINGLGKQRSSRLTKLLTDKVLGFDAVDNKWR